MGASSLPADSASHVSPSNTILFPRHAKDRRIRVYDGANLYFGDVLEICESSRQNVAVQSAVTRLEHWKETRFPWHEYVKAHVSYLVDGKICQEHSVEVEFHRFTTSAHVKKRQRKPSSKPRRSSVRSSVETSSQSSDSVADDWIIIRPKPHYPPSEIVASITIRSTAFSFELLVSLFDFVVSTVAPEYNPCSRNCYYLVSWLWSAALHFVPKPERHVDKYTVTVKAGRFGRLPLVHAGGRGIFLFPDQRVVENIDTFRQFWAEREEQFRSAVVGRANLINERHKNLREAAEALDEAVENGSLDSIRTAQANLKRAIEEFGSSSP